MDMILGKGADGSWPTGTSDWECVERLFGAPGVI